MWWMPNKKRDRENLAVVPHLASALLMVTRDRPMRSHWRAERIEARRILRRAVRAGYIEGGQARADLRWLREVLDEVAVFELEAADAPEGFAEWGSTYLLSEVVEFDGFAEVVG